MTALRGSIAPPPPISANGRRGSGRQGIGAPVSPAPLRARRRPAFVALGVALAALGGLLTAMIVARTGDRVAVLAVSQNVPVGSIITAQDLTIAHVASDSALTPIRVSEQSSVLGRVATVGLPAGSLLIRSELTATTVLAAGQQLVGVAVKPGQLPARPLTAGDKVLVAQTPGGLSSSGSGSLSGSVPTIPATVVDVSAAQTDGTVVVDLAVASSQGPQVAAIASTGRLALIEQSLAGGSP